jgi:hypothetical protein
MGLLKHALECRHVQQRIECYTIGSPPVGHQAWVDHYNRVVHSSWRFQKESDGDPELAVLDLLYQHVKGEQPHLFCLLIT